MATAKAKPEKLTKTMVSHFVRDMATVEDLKARGFTVEVVREQVPCDTWRAAGYWIKANVHGNRLSAIVRERLTPCGCGQCGGLSRAECAAERRS